MEWSDVLKAALAVFLVVTAVGLGYLLYRMAGLFLSLSKAVDRVTDETVPILSRAQLTMDGVNQEIGRVDEIMVSAVHATKGTEAAVGRLAHAISAPVRWGAGIVSGFEEAAATFRSRRAAERADRRSAYSEPPPPPPSRPAATRAPTTAPQAGPDPVVSEPAPSDSGSGGGGWAEQKARRAEAAAESADAARRRAGS